MVIPWHKAGRSKSNFGLCSSNDFTERPSKASANKWSADVRGKWSSRGSKRGNKSLGSMNL